MKAGTLLFGPPIAAMLALGQPKLPPVPVPTEQVASKVKHRAHKAQPKVERVAPGKAQPKPKKEQGKSTGRPAGTPKLADSGPDLPYSCATIRAFAGKMTPDEKKAQAARKDIPEKWKRQAAACFK